MLTDRQRMQIKRSIGYKHGLLPESVDLVNISNIKENIAIDGGRIKIQVDFSHHTGYWGSEIFSINPSDCRTSPYLVRDKSELFKATAKRLFGEVPNEELPKIITCNACGEKQPDIGREHCFWCMAELDN